MNALALIDLQRGFFGRPEELARLGPALARVNDLLAGFAARGLPVFVVRTIHKRDRSTWTLKMLANATPAMLEGSDDVADVEGLRLPAGAIPIVKTRRSAFLGTDFAQRLRARGASSLVLAGAMLEACVADTARDGIENDFPVAVAVDATVAADERVAKERTAAVAEDFAVALESTERVLARLLARSRCGP